MIDVSGSELFAVATKALLGAGVGRAVADDGARAALWLHAKGYNGTAAIVEASQGTTSAQAIGVAHVDLLVSGARESTKIVSIDSPVLFVGLLGVAASQYGVRFSATCAGHTSPVVITPTTISGPVEAMQPTLEVTCSRDPSDRRTDAAHAMRLSVNDAEWHQIAAAASRIYVPSTEQSRATGAGAGLVDRD